MNMAPRIWRSLMYVGHYISHGIFLVKNIARREIEYKCLNAYDMYL